MSLLRMLEKSKDTKIMFRSAKISLVVGTILVAINYGDSIFIDGLEQGDWLKIILTYMVPYFVSTYSVVVSSPEDI